MEKKKEVTDEAVNRLFIYAKCLEDFKAKGKEEFSSEEIADKLNLKPSLVRKDFSNLGHLGKRGVGYRTEAVLKRIKDEALPEKMQKVAIIGVGKLGSALINYYGFKARGFQITVGFDRDKKKIGKSVKDVKIHDIKKVKKIIEKKNIKIAIIAVPPEESAGVIKKIRETGIKAVLNFAPSCELPADESGKDFILKNIDISLELARLSYYLNENERKGD